MNYIQVSLLLSCFAIPCIIPANATESISLTSTQSPNDTLLTSAQSLNRQGIENMAIGKPQSALENWQQANKIYTQLKDKEGIIGTEINQAQAFQGLGSYHKSLEILKSVKSKLQKEPSSSLKAKGLMSLGNTLKSLRVLNRKNDRTSSEENFGAEGILDEALWHAKNINDPILISQVKMSLANTLELVDKKDARDQSMKIYQEVARTSDIPILKAQAKINLYRLELKEGVSPNTLDFLAKIQKELDLIPASRSTIYAYVNLAKIIQENKKDDFDDKELALKVGGLLTTAINQSRMIKDIRAESQSIGALGNLYAITDQNQHAQKLTEQAALLAESLPAPDIAYRLQWQLGKILAVNNAKNPSIAIAAYRQSINHLKTLRNDLNASDADLQFSFRDSVEPVYRELVSLLLQGDEKVATANIESARDLIESLQVAELENFLRQGCLDTYTVQLDKIDKSSAVIYPIVLPDRIAVITSIPQQPLRYHSLPIPSDEVELTVNNLRKIINNSSGDSLDPSKDFSAEKEKLFKSESKRIHDLLISPISSSLQKSNIKNLVFILDGALRNIPMSILYDGNSYLFEKYNLALTPGLQLVPPQNYSGNNQYQAFLGGISESRLGFDAIPAVKQELESISQLLPHEKLLNSEFNQKQATSRLNINNSSIVHIATHGEFNAKPEDTFILTWDKKLDLNQFNNLLQSRNAQVGKEIDLLILSACQTATGDNRATLGLAGVAVRARTKSTIASLWSVDDESTKLLMTDLYKNLIDKKLGKAESLRLAQKSLILNPKYRSPYYWAPFILVGNWQ